MRSPPDSPIPLDGSRLFAALDAEGRKRLMAAAERVQVGPDEIVLREGEVPEHMFIVLQGELQVTAARLDGETAAVGVLGPGEVFGEIGVLTGEPRTATVTATRPVWVMRLAAEAVRAVIGDYPEITGDLMRLGLQRSEATLAEVMRDEDG
jgi:CRP-like cAMP-binding protein